MQRATKQTFTVRSYKLSGVHLHSKFYYWQWQVSMVNTLFVTARSPFELKHITSYIVLLLIV